MGQSGILKRAVLAALGYIAIMAVGMYTAAHIFGHRYIGDPDIVRVLVFFEVVMSIYIFVRARRIFGHWQCGFSPIDWSGIWWMVPNFLIMAALFWITLSAEGAALTELAAIIIVTMCLVGFSEELTFRGVVLQGALRELGQGRAILLSAFLFSMLHSVNVLAFVPVENMLMQLVLTFIFGLSAACYALHLNSLIPLMVYHALWDMVQFLGGVYRAEFGLLVGIGIAINATVAAALYIFVLRKKPAGVLSAGN